jgi:hypothetical protein
MSTTTTGSVPGLVLPKVQASLAGNPNNSAIAASNQRAASHAALLNAVKGGKRGGAITVPQMPGDKSGANAVAAAQAQVSTQNASNSALDDLQAGGRRRTKGKRKRRRTTKGKKRRTSKRRSRRSKK